MKSKPHMRISSTLQEDILKHVTTTRDAGYDTLAQTIKKNRITILRSLSTLIKAKYVRKEGKRLDIDRNLKFIFKPTTKGVLYSVGYLGVSLESIVTGNGEKSDLVQYNELIKNLVDKSERSEFTKNTAKTLFNSDNFDRNGEMKITKGDDFFNYGFMSGLAGLARQDSEVQMYFNKLNIDTLRNIMSPEELKEIRNYYSKVKSLVSNVLDAIERGLSDEK